MQIQSSFDPTTYTVTYLVFDSVSKDAVVIDPVLDFDPIAAQTDVGSARQLLAFAREHSLRVHYVLETHAHADHLSSSQFLKRELGAKVAISARITDVQKTFKALFDLPSGFGVDGRQFDRLLSDGETFRAGTIEIEVIGTPGHTPACVTFKIEDAVFTGDALFMEDYGTGRCDFPGGSAEQLYDSIHDKLYALPDATRVFVGHDYQPNGRALAVETTIGRSKNANIQLRSDTSKEAYVALRKARDATLQPPRLLLQSVQVNVDAGRLPASHANEKRYLAMPLNLFRAADETGAPLGSEGPR